MPAKVLVCDNIHSAAVGLLNGIAQVKESGPLSEAELMECIGAYDAILVRSQTKVTAPVIEKAERLQMIARAGVGVDNIDIPAATKKGIMVVNSPEGNTIAAAEHTVALMLSLARHIPAADASMKEHLWQRKNFMGSELYGKVLGVVGLGKIGSHVARVAQSLGMTLLGYDPFVAPERAKQMGVELVTLEALYKESDYITLHVPATPDTKHMINANTLGLMKDSARIINCARGELIDPEALSEAIQAGRIAGAALDVFENEPLTESPLHSLGRKVILTPHLGASTAEAQMNVAIDVAQQVRALLEGKQVTQALNIPSMLPQVFNEVKDYFPLAEKLGYFLGQLQTSSIESVELSFHGELAEKNTSALKIAVLHGLLSPSLTDRVNYVNAGVLAKERGIKISEFRESDTQDYTNLIKVTVRSEQGTRSVAGSILGDQQERIVNIDSFPISCIPQGTLLVVPHPDQPGMVGVIGAQLGKHEINISGIQLGRHSKRGQAVMVVNLDQKISPELLAEIRSQPEFIKTQMVVL